MKNNLSIIIFGFGLFFTALIINNIQNQIDSFEDNAYSIIYDLEDRIKYLESK